MSVPFERPFATAGPHVAIAAHIPGLSALALVAAVAAAAVAMATINPLAGPPLAYDTYASTLHFDRIAAGRQLEAGLATTPKPLLTVVVGLVHAAGGWAAISIASILAWSAAVGLGTWLATRLAGIAAGAALAVLLIASPTLLLETAWGLASIWALGLWFGAALALTSRSPRWGLAGLLLGLAMLARLETLLAVGLALALLAVQRPRPAGSRRLGIALLALPVMLVHDALLTGDPFYWTRVSGAFGDSLARVGALPGVVDAVRQVAAVPSSPPLLSVLAAVGLVALVRRRAWPILVGLAAFGPGMAILLIALAASGRFVDPRYLVPIQATILLAAAAGIGTLASAVVERLALGRVLATATVVLLGIGGALVASPIVGPIDPATGQTIARFHALAVSADIASPVLQRELAAWPQVRSWPGTAPLGDRRRTDVLSVPGNLRPRLALDLGLPLTRLVSTDPAGVDPAQGSPQAGELVLHSGGEVPAAGFRVLEIHAPTPTGAVVMMPLLHDAAAATWILRLDGAGGFTQGGGQVSR